MLGICVGCSFPCHNAPPQRPSSLPVSRYADGDDREALEKATVKLTDEEAAARDAAIAEGRSVIESLNSRCAALPLLFSTTQSSYSE